MNNKELYLFLEVVSRRGSVSFLERHGLSIFEIADSIKRAIDKGLVEYIKDNLVLTSYGIEIFNVLSEDYKRINKEEWIDKENQNRIPKLDKDSIYLPNQNDLNFD